MGKEIFHYDKELVKEMIAHCPTLGVIDCIGLIELLNQYTAVTNTSKLKTTDIERIIVLAIKHCPSGHHDWPEIKELTKTLE